VQLYDVLAQLVDQWRQAGYPHAEYDTIGEVLQWARRPDGAGFRLRAPQIRALETYWYLRLIEKTPQVLALHRKYFQSRAALLTALGVPQRAFEQADYRLDTLWHSIRKDDEFVRAFRLQALRETITLGYPSYILALAMGAGKTVLIGSIFATEFAMALEYPGGPFVHNALVFAPGKTIIESLRELAEMPYDRVLPPRLFKLFAASVKLTFTRDGERDIPAISGSSFNVIITNTEKIRIEKEKVRASDIGRIFRPDRRDEAKAEVANLRLQKIASLPNLAVFSDEAHHTYGQSLSTGLKKVRKTVDYLAENTNVICVVNTTGTPYFKRQLLKDVVVWYSLSEGIRDGILKELAGNIQGFHFEGNVQTYLRHVIEDFFTDYGTVALPDGTPAKLAVYFPKTADVRELRPIIETKMAELGLAPALILEHHTNCENKADFDRFKFKDSPHRIALLVDRGVEGWDVPALFACALARRLRSSNNFVLQAACRCLRQLPGNEKKARVYLSLDNFGILDRQLQETYGETISDLNRAQLKTGTSTIRVRKLDVAPVVVRQIIRVVVRKPQQSHSLQLDRPRTAGGPVLRKITYTLSAQKATARVLQQVGDSLDISAAPKATAIYSAAVELAAIYRLPLWELYEELKSAYDGAAELPVADLGALAEQIEEQTRDYEVREETVEKALALVKLDGFKKDLEPDGSEVYTAEISYPIDREKLLVAWADWANAADGFGFHYSPYNFDSNPEKSFFEQLLGHIRLNPDEVEDIYFTGGLTDPKKTDFYVEYKGEDGAWRRYTPDFIIRRKDKRCLIVEIKDARFQAATREDLLRDDRGQSLITVEGRKAVALRKWERLSPDRLKYQVVFAKAHTVSHDDTKEARAFVEME